MYFHPLSFYNLEVPSLLDDLRNTMKDYILLETKYHDLKTSKQKVNQECIQKIADDVDSAITLDDINEVRMYF